MLRRSYDSTTMPNIQNEYQTLKIVLSHGVSWRSTRSFRDMLAPLRRLLATRFDTHTTQAVD